ncbi:MAG: CPBP family intramembrane metalloprotease [Cyclobacteriaceae bacterium]|nr:CPBP family intramembrane metalloprotease [Cyclobacteriaceae bacterium]
MEISKTARNVIIFSIAALGVGWLGVWLDGRLPAQEEEETLGMAVWLVLPLLVVIVLRTFAGDGWKDAGLHPRFRGNSKWYLWAFIIFPLVTGLTLALGYVTRWIDFTGFDISSYAGVFVSLFFVNIVKNIFEESVWRGYLTVKLVKLGLQDISIYLIAGLIWGFWHAPYYLVFLPEESMYTVLPVDRITFALVAVVSMVIWTVMFTELYRLTGSIWPLILLHAVEDALINHLVIDGYIQISAGMEWVISPISGLIPNLMYLAIGLWLRRERIKAQAG